MDRINEFCRAYVATDNATEAAIRAGYPERSARTRGSELLKRQDVLEYLAALRAGDVNNP
jgi:phage terminase small subunit